MINDIVAKRTLLSRSIAMYYGPNILSTIKQLYLQVIFYSPPLYALYLGLIITPYQVRHIFGRVIYRQTHLRV